MASVSRRLAGLAQAGDYTVLFCDVWGVIHNGVAHNPSACEALVRFRSGGGTVILVSNAPRPHGDIVPQLQRLGVPDGAWDAIVTSGDVTRTLMAARAGEPVHFIGPDRDLPLFAGLSAPHVGVAQACYCVCTGLLDDERETPADYAAVLRQMADRQLPMICANPDLVVERGNRLIPCAGALGAAYEAIGGLVTYPGKPYRPIYEMALELAGTLRGAPVGPAAVLAIGDAIRTDVAGAVMMGIDVVMVLAGIHAGETMAPDGTVDADRIALWLKGQDVQPGFFMPVLCW